MWKREKDSGISIEYDLAKVWSQESLIMSNLLNFDAMLGGVG